MHTNRREFLGRCASLAAAVSVGHSAGLNAAAGAAEPAGRGSAVSATAAAAANYDPSELLIVDTHQHLWDRSRLDLRWLDGAPEVLRPSFLPDDYAQATQGLPMRAVYMEVDVADGQHDREVDWVAELCRGRMSATEAAVVGGRPDSPLFAAYLDRLPRPVVKGVRRVLHGDTPAGWCLRPDFVRGVRWLGDRGLRFDLCMRPGELGDAVTLTQLCPDTQFIVDHCGNADVRAFSRPGTNAAAAPSHSPDDWRWSMDRLAARPNTICKISGIVARAPQGWGPELLAPVVNHCLDAFGPDRVVFGSDWPVCLLGAALRDWVQALRAIVADRPGEQRARLWSDNALRWYDLPTTAPAA